MKLRTAVLASALALIPMVSLTAPAQASSDSDYQLRISGTAQIVEYPAWFRSPDIASTELRIPVSVRCPVGQTAGLSYTGLPAFFPPPDSRAFAHLPATAGPIRVECTGKWVTAYSRARSFNPRQVAPNYTQTPRFIPGSRLDVNVALWDSGVTVTDSRTVRVEHDRICGFSTGCGSLTP